MNAHSVFETHLYADPLFSAEGMDVAHARAALDAIESQLRKIDTLHARSSAYQEKRSIRSAVPIAFLRVFVAAEEARRAFLSDPSQATEQMLVESWRTAQEVLVSDISMLEAVTEAVRASYGSLQHDSFADAYGNSFSFDDAVAFLEPLRRNAEALEADILQRGSPLILRSSIPSCEPPHISPEHTRALRCEERAFGDRYDIVEEYGPIGMSLSVFDGTSTCHSFVAYIVRDKEGGGTRLKVSRADEFLFVPFTDPKRFAHSAFAPLVRAGLPAWYQPGARFYLTRDVRYWADIATSVDMKRRPELPREALLSQRSSMLDLILWNAVDEYDHYIRVLEAGNPNADSQLHGFLMHMHPSIFFLPFNASVWRIPEPRFLGRKRVDAKESPYRTLEQVFPSFDDEMLTKVMRGWLTREEAWAQKKPSHDAK